MDGFQLESDNRTCAGNDHNNCAHAEIPIKKKAGHLDPGHLKSSGHIGNT